VFPDLDYIGGYIDGEIASLYIDHPSVFGRLAHFQVLKDYRKHSRELFKLSVTGRTPVYVKIPVLYKEVINFAKHMGFRETQTISSGFLKHGIHYDQKVMVLK